MPTHSSRPSLICQSASRLVQKSGPAQYPSGDKCQSLTYLSEKLLQPVREAIIRNEMIIILFIAGKNWFKCQFRQKKDFSYHKIIRTCGSHELSLLCRLCTPMPAGPHDPATSTTHPTPLPGGDLIISTRLLIV